MEALCGGRSAVAVLESGEEVLHGEAAAAARAEVLGSGDLSSAASADLPAPPGRSVDASTEDKASEDGERRVQDIVRHTAKRFATRFLVSEFVGKGIVAFFILHVYVWPSSFYVPWPSSFGSTPIRSGGAVRPVPVQHPSGLGRQIGLSVRHPPGRWDGPSGLGPIGFGVAVLWLGFWNRFVFMAGQWTMERVDLVERGWRLSAGIRRQAVFWFGRRRR